MTEIVISNQYIDYNDSYNFMKQRVAAIHADTKPEMLWILEHNHVYTAGTSANRDDLLQNYNNNDCDDMIAPIPVYVSNRGGKHTYHGPGQIIFYTMLNLQKRSLKIKQYITKLEQITIDILKIFNITAERRNDRIGVWVVIKDEKSGNNKEYKIAAIGARVSRSITYHGMSLNWNPDLSKYKNIIPCGIKDYGITSMYNLGIRLTRDEIIALAIKAFYKIFQI